VKPRVLVVAGHDPSYGGPRGGAGVDADREAIERAGGTALCVVSAWTEQDGLRVHAVRAREAPEWLAEARRALGTGAAVRALKGGLLADAASVRAFGALAGELLPGTPVVLDPVLAASGGEPFLDAEGVAALRAELLARGPVLTPNLPEAARLAGAELAELQRSRPARVAAARTLLALGAGAVVLKGGHADDARAADLVLARGARAVWIERPRLAGRSLHGSGCRFAATLAAELARGSDLETAARRAGDAVARLLAARAADGQRASSPP
jgi:hydroxymethylpyrimidine/phosphomethylpyrimidine kinase